MKSIRQKKLNIYNCHPFLRDFLTSWTPPCSWRVQYVMYVCMYSELRSVLLALLHARHACCSGRMVIMCHWKLFMRFFFIHSGAALLDFHFPYLWSVRYTIWRYNAISKAMYRRTRQPATSKGPVTPSSSCCLLVVSFCLLWLYWSDLWGHLRSVRRSDSRSRSTPITMILFVIWPPIGIESSVVQPWVVSI